MRTKLTIVDNLTLKTEKEAFSDKNLSKASFAEIFQEFGLEYSDSYYIKKYLNCYVLREREGYCSIKIEFVPQLN